MAGGEGKQTLPLCRENPGIWKLFEVFCVLAGWVFFFSFLNEFLWNAHWRQECWFPCCPSQACNGIQINYTRSTFFSSFYSFPSWVLLGVGHQFGLKARHSSSFVGVTQL